MSNTIRAPKHSHEKFEVPAETKSNTVRKIKKLVVRDDRYQPQDYECHLVIDGVSYEVIDYSSYGVAIFTEQPIQFPNEHFSTEFLLGGTLLSTFEMKVVRNQKVGETGFKIAFEIVSEEPLCLHQIKGATGAKQVIGAHHEESQELARIPIEFKHLVYEIKDSLESLQEKVLELEKAQTLTSNYEVQVFENSVAKEVASYLNEIFKDGYTVLHDIIDSMDDEIRKSSYEFFRSKLSHLLYQTSFGARCLEKPLGYAGDHEMMSFLYRNETIGKSLFAKCLHRFYMDHTNGNAVRNRGDYLTHKLESHIKQHGSVKSLSVACGPAYEMSLMIAGKANLEGSEFHLLDQDISALQSAQRTIKTMSRQLNRPIEVNYLHKAIRNIIGRKLTDTYDVIYSAGLFDYFSDPVAVAAAKALYKQLEPGGKLIIGNFTTAKDSKLFMELSLDWHLIYRTEEDLRALYKDIGKLTIESEAEGVNLFVVLEK